MANPKRKSPVCRYSYISLVPASVFLGLTLFLGVLLASQSVHAESSGVVNLSMEVPASCSISINQATHSAMISSGDSGTIGASTVKSVCNDQGGLAVYAVGYTGDSYGNTDLVASAGSSNYTISSAVAQSPTDSQWNMTLAQVSGAYAPTIVTGYDAAHVIPQQYTKVAYRDSATDGGNGATGANFTATFNAYVSLSQPAGSYTGKVKFLLVHPNVLTWDNGVPDDVQPSTLDRDPEASTCTTPVPGITYMQEVNSTNLSSILASMTEGAEYRLRDSRDNKDYCVGKLADGNLWMTQNLDHDITAGRTYTSADTDIPANWTPSTSTIATNDNTWDESSSFLTAPESYDPGDVYWNGSTGNNSYTDSSGYISSTGDSHYHLGNYYNWTAAVAMTDSSSYTNRGNLVDQSICPAGWTLPRAGTGDDSFYQLLNYYNIPTGNANRAWDSPLYFSLAGYRITSSVVYVGGYCRLWSSVVYDGYDAYNAYMYYSNINSSNLSSRSDYRTYGFSVRCVARPVSSSISGL